MSSNWREYTLDELCLKITDGSHQSPKAYEGGRPMFSVKDMTEFGFSYTGVKRISEIDYLKLVKQGCRPEMNDILIAKDGSIMKHVFKVESDIEGVLLSSIAIIRPNLKKVDPDFLVWSLLNPAVKEDILNNYVSGSGVPRIVLKDFKKIVLKVPENLNDQKETVKILRSLNKKIKLNRQTNQTLEQISQAIFKSWFVDFDPVKAKIAALEAGGSENDALLAAMQAIAGSALFATDAADADAPTQLARLQTEHPEQYATLRATAELFPSAMQESELGEIPEGWVISQIGDEVTVVGGGTPSTKNPEFWEGGTINWTTPKDLSNQVDKVLIDTDRRITQAGLNRISSGLLPVDTVLMSSRAPVGYLALAKTPIAVNQGYIAMKCEQTLSPEFVIQWCETNMAEIKSRASGTTFAEISKKSFNIIPVLVPQESLISVYSKHVHQLYLKVEMNVRENKSLAELRDTLLPKLLSGEIDVSALADNTEANA